MKTPIRTAIAGFGLSGKIFQAPFIHADPNFELKKVYERKTDRAKEEYPYVQIVRSFEELLTDDIDLVIISTPNDTHVPFAKLAMAAGKHVVVESPWPPPPPRQPSCAPWRKNRAWCCPSSRTAAWTPTSSR